MSEQPVEARVTASFAASAERVFEAWVNPELARVWMTAAEQRGPKGEFVRVTIDPRLGGGFSWVVRRQGQEFDHIGTYLEFDRPRRLVFRWAVRGMPDEPSRVSIHIAPRGSGCEVTLVHEMAPKWKDFVERGATSWRLMLGCVGEALA